MNTEDRTYLNGLLDDLCARHGFTRDDVERAERRRRMKAASDRLAASVARFKASFADLAAAFATTPDPNDGRYRFEEVHVRADLSYLLAEARRARRQRLRDIAALAARVERAEAVKARVEAWAADYFGDLGVAPDDLRADLSAPQPADAPEGHGDADEAVEGCDCTELCAMGPTCPGGMLARLPGSGCWRTQGDA